MTPKELQGHKHSPKRLTKVPQFSKFTRNKLPKPFKHIGGPRFQSTGLVDVSDTHAVIFYWRNGEILTDTAFYGHLMCRLGNNSLNPLFEFHWHPSHKGFHCKIPCRTEFNYTDRLLPGAPEFSIKTKRLDPRNENDRITLIYTFCRACGIALGEGSDSPQSPLDTLWE
jgi:hypothetical protein